MKKFDILFNECCNNINVIVREGIHTEGVTKKVQTFLLNSKDIMKLHDINFMLAFKDTQAYRSQLRGEFLDLLDKFLTIRDKFVVGTSDYRVVNSIYDCVREFYFNAVENDLFDLDYEED